MSYLNLPSLGVADNAKGTISLWFRVSGDSVQKARQHGENYLFDPLRHEIFRGVIPLVTFGRTITGTIWDSEGRMDCRSQADSEGRFASLFSFHPVNPTESPMEPSHIGLKCWPGETVLLRMVFQTPSQARAQGLVTERVECHYPPLDPEGQVVPFPFQTIADVSYIRVSSPDAFVFEPEAFEVELDKWHHILASWDFSTSVDVVAIVGDAEQGDAISGSCKFYYAFDDENKSGHDNMGDDSWAYKGDNDVVPTGAALADFTYIPHPPPPLISGAVDIDPEWHWTAEPLPLSGGPVGVPASAEYVDNVYHVEMGELQFFVGLLVDTGDSTIRRAFVDEDGKPVKPKDTESMLGRRPDILLHKTSNWKIGKNTGSVGLTRNPMTGDVLIESGQFEPIGEIKQYKPDPSLEESTA